MGSDRISKRIHSCFITDRIALDAGCDRTSSLVRSWLILSAVALHIGSDRISSRRRAHFVLSAIRLHHGSDRTSDRIGAVSCRNDAVEMGNATVPVAPVGVPPTGSRRNRNAPDDEAILQTVFSAGRRKTRARRRALPIKRHRSGLVRVGGAAVSGCLEPGQDCQDRRDNFGSRSPRTRNFSTTQICARGVGFRELGIPNGLWVGMARAMAWATI